MLNGVIPAETNRPAKNQNLINITPDIHILRRAVFSKNRVARIRKLRISAKRRTKFSCRLLKTRSVEVLEGVENSLAYSSARNTIWIMVSKAFDNSSDEFCSSTAN